MLHASGFARSEVKVQTEALTLLHIKIPFVGYACFHLGLTVCLFSVLRLICIPPG